MFFKLKTDTKVYKAFVILSGCLTMFLRAIFIYGTLPVLANYYERRFDDRKLSSMIGSIQISVNYLTALPVMRLSEKIPVGWTQILGGLLPCIGLVGTAFSTEAWHALIFNGIITGVGSSCLLVECYRIVPMYFTGKDQAAACAALVTSLSLGSLATAQTLSSLTNAFGFKYCLCICGGIMMLNAVTGFFYRAPDPNETEENEENAIEDSTPRRRSLIFRSNSQGVFIVPEMIKEFSPIETPRSEEYDNSNDEIKIDQRCEDAESVTTLSHLSQKWCKLRKCIWASRMVILVIVASALGQSGHSSLVSNLADYTRVEIKLEKDVYDLGVTILGVARLVTGMAYIGLAKFFIFSSATSMLIGTVGQGVCIIGLLCQPTVAEVYILMALNGLSMSLLTNSSYTCYMQLGSSSSASLLYMVDCQLCGYTILASSALASYLQVEVYIDAGFYLSLAMIVLSALIVLPIAISTLTTHKVYTYDTDNVQTTHITVS